MKTPIFYKKRLAFTIIELLVSVSIMSVSIIFVLKLHTDNHHQITYLSERNKRTLSDSLFLTKKILDHDKDNKDAYELLRDDVYIKESDTKDVLKKEKRDIVIPEEIEIKPPEDTPGPVAIVNEVKLKGIHASHYWHFRIQSF